MGNFKTLVEDSTSIHHLDRQPSSGDGVIKRKRCFWLF